MSLSSEQQAILVEAAEAISYMKDRLTSNKDVYPQVFYAGMMEGMDACQRLMTEMSGGRHLRVVP